MYSFDFESEDTLTVGVLAASWKSQKTLKGWGEELLDQEDG